MYHRDISPTLWLFAIVLTLFVAYQAWLKPTYFGAGPVSRQSSESAQFQAPSDLTFHETQEPPSWDAPQTRLLDPGPAPNSTLGSIRDELEKGNYSLVERRLRILPDTMLGKNQMRRYVAALWNNLGVQQEKFGGSELSVKAFKKSVALDAASSLAHLNLTQAYWELRDPAMTPQFLEIVIRLAPGDPFPHLALADLLLEKGRVASAATHLNHARPRVKGDPSLGPYLQKLTAKVESISPGQPPIARLAKSPQPPRSEIARPLASSAESRPSSSAEPTIRAVTTSATPPTEPLPIELPRHRTTRETVHFTVQFDGPPDQAAWMRMRAILDYAFEECSQKFGHAPAKPIAVVLHTNQNFVSTAGSPTWADTLFDQTSGAIHLPTQGALEDLALFSRIARHEFVHALLFEHLKGRRTGVPTWLIEGLAIQLAEDPWSDVEDSRHKNAALIPLTSLQGEWKQLPIELWPSAYLESGSATQNLVDRYSMYGVRQVMNVLQNGQSLDSAMQQKLSLSYEQFQRQWTENFSLSARVGKS